MPPYKKMYFHLFIAITDALEKLQEKDYGQVRSILIKAQQWGETMYIESGEKGND